MPGLDTWSPLFSSIVYSSIWGQAPHVKIVWITMLALKDRTGFVESSVSGLARAAVVTLEQCQEALDIFLSPDDDSKCKDNQGLKIAAVPGGWMVLGHERFQERMKEVTRKIGNAKRQARHRAKKKSTGQNGRAAGSFMAHEKEYLAAVERGDQASADAIVARDLPGTPSP